MPSAWLIDTEFFCKEHEEKIIEAFGVDRFPIRRLTESDRAFHGLQGEAAFHESSARRNRKEATK